MVYDAMSKHRGGTITPDLFSELSKTRALKRSPQNGPKLPTLKQASEHLVVKAVEEAGQNQSKASKILGISQQALSKRLQKLKSKS